MAKKKIAILGGGPGGLTAAYNLTSQPGWQDAYEITIYQLGFRVGGKGATGRNLEANDRIQEHGIHLFANMYANAFRMVDTCISEVRWLPEEPSFLQSMTGVFIPNNFQLTTEYHEGTWRGLPTWLPFNSGCPWEGDYLPSLATMVESLIKTVYSIFTGKEAPDPAAPRATGERLAERAGADLAEHVTGTLELPAVREDLVADMLRRARDIHQPPSLVAHASIIGDLEKLLGWVRNELQKGLDELDRWRWIFIQLDYYITFFRGFLADGLVTGNVDSIDGVDYREWLRRNGADAMTLASPLTQAIPNVCFQYPDGDTTRMPSMSAAAYVTFMARQLCAQGQSMYFFADSTGDAIILPIYRALVQRGVKFEFFHRVTSVVPSADGRTIDSIEMQIQATTVGGVPYDPLVTIAGGQRVWPSRPIYERLEQGTDLAPFNLESVWTPWPGVGTRVLKKHEGFDDVVFAMPVGSIPYVAEKILEIKPAWRDWVRGLPTIATQQVQIWLSQSTTELGWSSTLGGTNRTAGASYINPLSDFADFSDVIQRESWPGDNLPRGLIYFCGALQDPLVIPPPTDHGYPATQHDRVVAGASQALRTLVGLLPGAGGSAAVPTSLDFNTLT